MNLKTWKEMKMCREDELLRSLALKKEPDSEAHHYFADKGALLKGLPILDVAMVMHHGICLHKQAIDTLVENEGDIVNSIMQLRPGVN